MQMKNVEEIMEKLTLEDLDNLRIEEMNAEELAFADGRHYKLMSSSQDHKRAGDGDTGKSGCFVCWIFD